MSKCFEELYIASVLRAQNVNIFLLTCSKTIECFLYIKLLDIGAHSSEIWEFQNSLRLAGSKNIVGLGQQFYFNELR